MQGRSGKTGIATTFINSRQCSESILLDLKHLLKEAKQRVPHFLTVRATLRLSTALGRAKHSAEDPARSLLAPCIAELVPAESFQRQPGAACSTDQCMCFCVLHISAVLIQHPVAHYMAGRGLVPFLYALLNVASTFCPASSTQALHDPLEEMEALAAASGIKGCAYCGGLGHRIADCPKLRSESKAQERSKKDYFGSGGFGGEM